VPALHGAVFLFPIPLASFMPDERGLITLATGWIGPRPRDAALRVGTAFIVLILAKSGRCACTRRGVDRPAHRAVQPCG